MNLDDTDPLRHEFQGGETTTNSRLPDVPSAGRVQPSRTAPTDARKNSCKAVGECRILLSDTETYLSPRAQITQVPLTATDATMTPLPASE